MPGTAACRRRHGLVASRLVRWPPSAARTSAAVAGQASGLQRRGGGARVDRDLGQRTGQALHPVRAGRPASRACSAGSISPQQVVERHQHARALAVTRGSSSRAPRAAAVVAGLGRGSRARAGRRPRLSTGRCRALELVVRRRRRRGGPRSTRSRCRGRADEAGEGRACRGCRPWRPCGGRARPSSAPAPSGIGELGHVACRSTPVAVHGVADLVGHGAEVLADDDAVVRAGTRWPAPRTAPRSGSARRRRRWPSMPSGTQNSRCRPMTWSRRSMPACSMWWRRHVGKWRWPSAPGDVGPHRAGSPSSARRRRSRRAARPPRRPSRKQLGSNQVSKPSPLRADRQVEVEALAPSPRARRPARRAGGASTTARTTWRARDPAVVVVRLGSRPRAGRSGHACQPVPRALDRGPEPAVLDDERVVGHPAVEVGALADRLGEERRGQLVEHRASPAGTGAGASKAAGRRSAAISAWVPGRRAGPGRRRSRPARAAARRRGRARSRTGG